MRIGDTHGDFVIRDIERNYEGKIIYIFLLDTSLYDESDLGLEIMYRNEYGDYDDGNTITRGGNYTAQLAYIQNGEFYYPPMNEDVMFLSLELIKGIKHENKLIEMEEM